ncbi:S8 family serine peptidase [Candidatus Woesearchaeota archaeon]|nr:S8 family serine peptidase [Candidatus Woesearchaeota archaeon]
MLKRGILIFLIVIFSSSIFAINGDFDKNGCVEFSDFTQFVVIYQAFNENGTINLEIDLDGDGWISIDDFFVFADNFGICKEKKEPTSQPIGEGFPVSIGESFTNTFTDIIGILQIGNINGGDLIDSNDLTVHTSLTSKEDDYKSDVVLEIDRYAIKYFLDFKRSGSIGIGTSLNFLGHEIKIISIDGDNKMEIEIDENIRTTIKDGSDFIDKNLANPNWVWELSGLKTNAPYIGIKNQFVINDASDNPLKIGDCIELPGDPKICFNGLNVADDEYTTLTIAYESNADLSDAEPGYSSVKSIYINSNKNIISTSGALTNKLWILGDGQVFYLNPDTNKITSLTKIERGVNYALAFLNSDLELDASFTDKDERISIKLLDKNSDEILISKFKIENSEITSLGDSPAFEEPDELIWDYAKSFDLKNIGTNDEDHRSAYGIIIRDPKAHGSNDEVVFEIPDKQVKALIGVNMKLVEPKDIDFINLRDGQILTSDNLNLNIRTKDKSICGYGLFKEAITKTASDDLGNPFKTSDGFVHTADLKLEDGNYLLFVKCNSNGNVKEKSINFKVALEGINAEISVATIRDYFWDDQRIELTDPPAEENNKISSNGFLIYEDTKISTFPDKEIYIVQFLDDSLIRKRLLLEENRDIPNLRDELNSLKASGKLALGKRISLAFSENEINNDLRNELEKIEKLHNDFKNDILGLSLPKNAATKPIPIEILFEYSKAFNGVAIRATPEIVEEIKKLPYVKNVEKEKFFEPLLIESTNLIGANYVWDNIVDDNGLSVTGKGIRVAVIDTGVDYTHPDLGGCTTEQFLEGKCKKVVKGYDFGDDDPDPIDDSAHPGHGTHVASTMAGKGILNGVAPDADIYAYKIARQSGGLGGSSIFAAWEAIADLDDDGIPFEDKEDRVDVVSMSFGTSFGWADDEFALIVDDLVDNGIVAVISAGNSGPEKFTIGSPGTSRNAITVGASYKTNYENFWLDCNPGRETGCKSNDNPGGICPDNGKIFCNYWKQDNPRVDQVTIFSSRGPDIGKNVLKPDIVAPGAIICAARYDNIFEKGKNNYYYPCVDDKHVQIAGTSMSAPIVSGAVALLLQKNPNWNPFEVKQALRNTAFDLGYDIYTQGAGRINIKNALSLKNPPPIINSIKTDKNMAFVYGEFNNNDFVKYEIYLTNAETTNSEKIYEASDIEGNLIASFDFSSFEIAQYLLELKLFDNLGNVVGYADYTFEIPEFNVELVADKGIDENGNGLFESIDLELLVDSKVDDTYTFFILLKAQEKDSIAKSSLDISDFKSVELKKGEKTTINYKFNILDIKYNMIIYDLDYDIPFTLEIFAFKGSDKYLLDEFFVQIFRTDLQNLYSKDNFEKLIDVSIQPNDYYNNRMFSGIANDAELTVRNYGDSTEAKISAYKKKISDDGLEALELIETKDINLKTNAEEILTFSIIPEEEGELLLKFIVELEDDIDKEDNYFEVRYKVFPPSPDINVNFESVYLSPILIWGEDNEIIVKVSNDGAVDAENVKLSLFSGSGFFTQRTLIGEEIVDVAKSDSKLVKFKFNPDSMGEIFLLITAETENDLNLDDNSDSKAFTIVSDFDVRIRDVIQNNPLFKDKEGTFDFTLENIGLSEINNINVIISAEYKNEIKEISNFFVDSIKESTSQLNTIKWTPDGVGSYLIKFEAKSDQDMNLENNIKSISVYVGTYEPDVTGSFNWNVDKLIIGGSYDLNFDIKNKGFFEANNITISLWKDDELIDGRFIDRLDSGERNTTTLRWTPEKEDVGWNNLKLIVDAENDANPDNNIYKFSLKVLSDKGDISVYAYSEKDFVVDKENNFIVQLENSGGKDALDVNLFLSSINEITKEETPLVHKMFGSIDAGTFTEWSFPYTPNVIGFEIIKIVVEAEGDENLENNQNQRRIKIIPQSRLKNLGNNVLSGHLFIDLQKKENDQWVSYKILIDDLKRNRSRSILEGSFLALDQIFNREYGALIIEDEGEFRIYVAFLDDNGSIIKTIENKNLEASYQFNKRNYHQPIPIPGEVSGGSS